MKLKLSIAASLFLATLFSSICFAQQSWSPEHVYYGKGGDHFAPKEIQVRHIHN